MATVNDVYTHLKTLTKKWFYDKTEIDKKLEGSAQDNIAGKVDKVSGKGLSTNDYTTEEKNKLAGISAGATNITVDAALSSTSTNPVENQAINTALGGKAPISHASSTSTYGLGTTSNYGHVKIVNGLTQSAHQNGIALSAYQGKVLNDGKVDKVSGKGLSTNDFTDVYKNKIDQLGEDLNSINMDWDSITNKPASFTPTSHQHITSDIYDASPEDYSFLDLTNDATQHYINTEIDSALYDFDDRIDSISTDWADITNKPASFTPASHSHGNISNDGKMTDTINNGLLSGAFLIRNNNNIISAQYMSAAYIKDASAHSNINSAAYAAQSTINQAIDTKLGDAIFKSNTVGLLKNDGSIDTNTYLTQHQDITGKANQSDLTALTSRVSALETSEFQIVFKSSKSQLPATGRANTLYYVANSDSGENTYDEYTWVASKNDYELMGPKTIDLSGYLQTANLLNEIDSILTQLNSVTET